MSDLENVDLIVASKDESYGGILKLGREKKGLSIEDVCDDLHLDRKIIYALENHNLEDLPEPAFVCGYIRNYARFLKLQPEPIVADFKKKVSLSADINAINTVGDLSYSRQERRFHLLIFFLIFVLVGGGYFGWEFWKNNNIQDTKANELETFQENPSENTGGDSENLFKAFDLDNNQSSNSSSEKKNTLVASTEELSRKENSQNVSSQKENSQNSAMGQADASSVPMEQQITEELAAAERSLAGQVAEKTESASASNENSLSTARVNVDTGTEELEKQLNNQSNQLIQTQKKTVNQKRIKFSFAKDSWVSVKDANDKTLVYDLMRAGEELELKGVVPIRVFLGDATGVSLLVEEQKFDVSGYINRKNIAKFSVN